MTKFDSHNKVLEKIMRFTLIFLGWLFFSLAIAEPANEAVADPAGKSGAEPSANTTPDPNAETTVNTITGPGIGSVAVPKTEPGATQDAETKPGATQDAETKPKPKSFVAVYKCIDAKGNIDYQASLCPEGIGNIAINIKTGRVVNLDEEKKKLQLTEQQQSSIQESEKKSKQELEEQKERQKSAAIAESAKNQEFIKLHPDTFSPYALPPYEPENLTDLVKIHKGRLVEIEQFRRLAAEKALRSGDCSRVEASELDMKSTRTLLGFLVNCSSGKAFYITEQDLKR
jgi:hypothetical protein